MDSSKSYYFASSGFTKEVEPKDDKKHFTFEELKDFIGGGMVEIVPLPSGRSIIVDEEGKLNNLPVNEKATDLWKEEYPIGEYPNNNDELIVGDCLVAGVGSIE